MNKVPPHVEKWITPVYSKTDARYLLLKNDCPYLVRWHEDNRLVIPLDKYLLDKERTQRLEDSLRAAYQAQEPIATNDIPELLEKNNFKGFFDSNWGKELIAFAVTIFTLLIIGLCVSR